MERNFTPKQTDKRNNSGKPDSVECWGDKEDQDLPAAADEDNDGCEAGGLEEKRMAPRISSLVQE